MLRIFLATLLSPLWAPIYTAFFANLAIPGQAEVGTDWTLLYKASVHWTFGFVYGYIPMIVLAPLAHMLLRWRKYESVFAYAITWCLLSHLLWWGHLNLAPVQGDVGGALITSLLFNLPWIPAGVTFWAIVRPDKRESRSGRAINLGKTTNYTAATPAGKRSSFGMRGRTLE